MRQRHFLLETWMQTDSFVAHTTLNCEMLMVLMEAEWQWMQHQEEMKDSSFLHVLDKSSMLCSKSECSGTQT